jgi:cell division protein FtsQ
MAQLKQALGEHSYFSVREIRVTGSQRLSRAQIVSIAGLKPGMNIWEIDSRSIEMKLSSHPWIRQGMVRREFPQRVLIRVEEWVPKAIVALEKLYYVDREGYIFKTVQSGEAANLPFITGLGNEETVFDNPFARQKIVEAIKLNDRLTANSVALSEIRFLSHEGVVVYPISHPVPLYMGWGDWPVKVQRLKRVLAEWKGREKRLASLNMSFRNQIVVKLKGD